MEPNDHSGGPGVDGYSRSGRSRKEARRDLRAWSFARGTTAGRNLNRAMSRCYIAVAAACTNGAISPHVREKQSAG